MFIINRKKREKIQAEKNRIQEIIETMKRYIRHDVNIPAELVEELERLCK